MRIFKRQSYKTHSDEELIIAYRQDQRAAILGEMYLRYAHLVLGTCMKYMKNQHDAEDVCMHVFEHLGRKLLQNDIQQFKGWLYTVTRNECLMKLRKKGTVSLELTREPGAEEDSADKGLLEIQLTALEAAIEELKEEQRECIRLFYLERKSYEQVALALNLDLNKVKSAIQNGKRNLKIQLEGRNEFKSNP
jgi:RNA polymerase sigma-70 factor (ECF subfamily)